MSVLYSVLPVEAPENSPVVVFNETLSFQAAQQ
jgi:hypothetical protein